MNLKGPFIDLMKFLYYQILLSVIWCSSGDAVTAVQDDGIVTIEKSAGIPPFVANATSNETSENDENVGQKSDLHPEPTKIPIVGVMINPDFSRSSTSTTSSAESITSGYISFQKSQASVHQRGSHSKDKPFSLNEPYSRKRNMKKKSSRISKKIKKRDIVKHKTSKHSAWDHLGAAFVFLLANPELRLNLFLLIALLVVALRPADVHHHYYPSI